MDAEDLDRLVATTRNHEVLLLQEIVPTPDGWVREVFLRRGWINLDLLWAIALFAAGALLLVPALHV